jgi:alpha-1,2-mannosyltransferase
MASHRSSQPDGVGGVEGIFHRLQDHIRATRLVIALAALASCAGALAVAIADAMRHQIDFDIYRMGAADVLGQGLYSARLPSALMGGGLGLHFTYPPFAALAFLPFAHLGVTVGQEIWSVANVLALALLVVLSIRMIQPSWSAGRAWLVAALTLFPIVRLEPDSLTLAYGQVNIFIVLLIILDFSGEKRLGPLRSTRGILIGIAAAVKLTPLIFIPFLFLTRQVRAAVTALVSFLACTLLAAAVAPHSSWLYWSTEIFDAHRSGNLLYISNQNLHSVVQRLLGAPPPLAVYAVLTIVFAAGGLAIATWAYRASSPAAGILVCAVTGLIVSPVSWAHHYVWIVLALAWLTLARDRPPGGPLWALGAAVVFWIAPIWWVTDQQSGYGDPLTLIEGNAFVLAAGLLLVLVAVMLWLRERSSVDPVLSGTGTALAMGRVPSGPDHVGNDADPERSGGHEGHQSRELITPGEHEQVGHKQHEGG